ncbi:hypothetical protein D3C86_1750260 [compost metagenome]
MIRRSTQGCGPDGGTDPVEQQVTPGRVTGQADGHRHHRAQAIDEAKTQHPDIRVAANVFECPVAHHLPARFACQQLAPVFAPHEVPQLVTGIAAEKRDDDHQVDVHVTAKREEAGKNQDGFAFEERTKKKG